MTWTIRYTPVSDQIEFDTWLCGIADGMEGM